MKSIIMSLWLMIVPVHAWAAACGGVLNPILMVPLPILFSAYHPTSNGDLTGNGTITVTCTVTLGSTLPDFTLGISAGGANSFTPRKMAFLTSTINYNIFTSGAYDTVWGDGTSSTMLQSYNHNDGLAAKSFTAFGMIPKHQYVLPGGPYLDALTVTISY